MFIRKSEKSMKKNPTIGFKNLTKLPAGGWQLKLKKDKKDIQAFAKTLSVALKARNEIYLKANYRPVNLFVNAFDLSVVSDVFRIGRSGNPLHHYQVHSRQLSDRKYSPKGFNSKVAAEQFATKWIKSYNAIAAIYNGWREEMFLQQIKDEEEQQKPCIETGFDVELWNKAAKEVFGSAIPRFFAE
ncbi:hypothetical protein EAY39_08110 [Vibrio anguillarum]|uniref:hypothetical protein n=1 Tax=Vibrio anguillarum TaxID=55601 RepID=UPI0018C325F6|nr:hypothetical protein [Vibrio anguillarum]MBF4340752.1 hypothetical protein [Vibrio anguillarum]